MLAGKAPTKKKNNASTAKWKGAPIVHLQKFAHNAMGIRVGNSIKRVMLVSVLSITIVVKTLACLVLSYSAGSALERAYATSVMIEEFS